ncbi:Trm112 family protein [Lysobacter humi (ex Lee et al. 2017)]
MDRKLLDLLACPVTRQPLQILDGTRLRALNDAIAAGHARRGDGQPQAQAVDAALATADGRWIYRIDDGIPVLLAEEAIDGAAFAAQP